MAQIILSINAGSSSVKVSVYKANGKSEDPTQLAEAQVEGLTAPPAKLKYERGDEKVKGKELDGIKTQEDAFRFILDQLTKDEGLPELNHIEDIKFTCHRVVHGGDYPRSQIIDEDTYHHIETLSDLAPLHNAPALTIVHAVTSLLPNATNIAYFDSSFHSTIPPHIHTYPIDQVIAKRNQLRKYGFHGISYTFIVHAVSAYLSKPTSTLNIIALHLGSGASACVIKGGKSLDTSMGLTPLAGLPGATRSGSIDPSLIFHFTHDAGMPSRSSSKHMHITTAEEILNKNSGWKSLTGTTDFGLISASDKPECQLAFFILVDRILNYVGSYYLKLGGEVDALVFAGGIGERGARLRSEVVGRARCLGFELDEGRNEEPGDGVVTDVGREGARHRTLICRTDEQLEMARGVTEESERFEGGEIAG
ncbi:acetate kinase [Lepidopterella palustris CBS 459.81]|uniref:Probable acetate kinase n=1 Tax=Lepidopterella palustris CBS 459.81 TaxID=1314670 RepID=A0A8E2E485_9PEZI|nr:acetate kinase [Lepidopterella palustris CBS 459.81]